jgi:hypothetical protein
MAVPMVLEMVDCPVCGAYSASINKCNRVKLNGIRHQLCSEQCTEEFRRRNRLAPAKSDGVLGGWWERIEGMLSGPACPKTL